MTTCLFEWCTVDHTDPHDDFDGCGSRFHYSDDPARTFTQLDEGNTWDRNTVSARWIAFEDVHNIESTRTARAALFVPNEPAFSATGLRAFAAWLSDLAYTVECLGAVDTVGTETVA